MLNFRMCYFSFINNAWFYVQNAGLLFFIVLEEIGHLSFPPYVH